MISQVAALSSTNSAIQSYANTVISDHQRDNYALENLASTFGVKTSGGITAASDMASARQVLAAVNTPNFDSVYLTAMEQINATSISNDGKVMTSTTNNDVLGYLQLVVTDDVSHLEGAKALVTGAGNTTFTSADSSLVQADFSGSNLEIELSQAVAPVTTNSAVTSDANMVTSAHTTANTQLTSIAAQNGLTLIPGVSAVSDLRTATQVLKTSKTPAFTTNYLNAMVATHGTALGVNAQALVTTTNASVLAFIESYIPMVIGHQEDAKALLGFTPTLATNSTAAPTGTTLSTADSAILTSDFSSGSLEWLISEIDVLTKGATTSVAPIAIADHQTDNYQLENLVTKYGVTEPVGISNPADIATANAFLATVNTSQVKASYLASMVSINSASIAADGIAISSAGNSDVRTYVETALPDDVTHLEDARQLQIGAGNATFAAADQASLQTTLSGSSLEIQLAQLDLTSETNPDITSFSNMLVQMHTTVNKQVNLLASKNHVALAQGVTVPADIATAATVQAAVGTSQFSTVYLTNIAVTHGVALGAEAMTLATTTNSALRSFVKGYIPMVISHEEQAEALLTGVAAPGKV